MTIASPPPAGRDASATRPRLITLLGISMSTLAVNFIQPDSTFRTIGLIGAGIGVAVFVLLLAREISSTSSRGRGATTESQDIVAAD